jgi:hypothetical protein
MTENLCPICGLDPEVALSKSMEFHIWWDHVPGTDCWCGEPIRVAGRWPTVDASEFLAHCAEKGGYLSHYLACQLGVVDG